MSPDHKLGTGRPLSWGLNVEEVKLDKLGTS